MNILRAADAERNDTPLALGVVRIRSAPVTLGIEVFK